ncbi:MAG: CcoQ/FixQ family Cbb3-type cytochrome c oxidase assembly chaperone [Anaeromyxobacteraceae bacterium]
MTPDVAYLVFGITLVVLLVGITAVSYSRRRKDRVEAPKYKMLEDDDR